MHRGVRRGRAEGLLDGLLRRPGRAHGRGGTRRGRRHLLQLQPRPGRAGRCPTRGPSPRPTASSTPGWPGWTVPWGACSGPTVRAGRGTRIGADGPRRRAGAVGGRGPHRRRPSPGGRQRGAGLARGARDLALWHAATVLREHRGDGHVAALVAAGLDGRQALVTMAATGAVPRPCSRRPGDGTTMRGTRRSRRSSSGDGSTRTAPDHLGGRGAPGDRGPHRPPGRRTLGAPRRGRHRRRCAPCSPRLAEAIGCQRCGPGAQPHRPAASPAGPDAYGERSRAAAPAQSQRSAGASPRG